MSRRGFNHTRASTSSSRNGESDSNSTSWVPLAIGIALGFAGALGLDYLLQQRSASSEEVAADGGGNSSGRTTTLNDNDAPEPLRENEQERTEQIEQHAVCTICCEYLNNCVFECGHRFCSSCARKLQLQQEPNCPLCKQPITNVRKTY